jgi:gamma-glutamylcyclotransferase (GGCT)/AIG2-like uncharacterized protein YtfP
MMIFVYGTLLKGQQRESVLTNSKYIGPAMIQAELFDLGTFPCVKKGIGTVIGELYEVDKETISFIDKIEKYDDGNIADSPFIREEVNACKFVDGKFINVFCYFYNYSITKNKIHHGDYRRYILEKNHEDQWILAYGSNLSIERLSKRVGKLKEYKKGFLDGIRLVFNIKASGKSAVYANIAYIGHGERCPAVAYKLSIAQVNILDQFEHILKYYLRIATPFYDNYGSKNIMQVYIANPERLVEGLSPEPEYVEYIKSGYREHGFDVSYLKDIINFSGDSKNKSI